MNKLIFSLKLIISPPSLHHLRIADILIRRGDIDEAIPLVRTMAGAVHTAELSDQYAELLAQMEGGNVDLQYLDRLLSTAN